MSKECMTCAKECFALQNSSSKNLISDHGTAFSALVIRPNTKFHFNVITKRHVEDLRGLTSQEWADILPVLKDGINKIETYYQHQGKPGPLGYRVSIPVGELSGQNQPPHFYMRVVPTYKKGYGSVGINEIVEGKIATPEQVLQVEQTLQPNTEGVINQTNKLVVKFHKNYLGFMAISTKAHLPNDISAMDAETWAEIGQMLQELMKKIEEGTDCNNFKIRIELGEKALRLWKEEAGLPSTLVDAYSDSEFVVFLSCRYKMERWWYKDERRPKRNNRQVGTMENERLAFKLNDPEGYAKEWGKEDKNNWETYLPISSTYRERGNFQLTTFQKLLPWSLGGIVITMTIGGWVMVKREEKKWMK